MGFSLPRTAQALGMHVPFNGSVGCSNDAAISAMITSTTPAATTTSFQNADDDQRLRLFE
jgi:hypothetical protein